MSAWPVPISCVPAAHAAVSARMPGAASVVQRSPGGYRFDRRPMRVLALGATVAVHLAVGAVVMLGWPGKRDAARAPHLAAVTLLPRPMDEPHRRARPGAHPPRPQPEPVPARSSPAPAIVLAPPTPIVIEEAAGMEAPVDGGRIDALTLATQAYRRAVMARLEAQRTRVRQDRAGVGAVIFHVERGGRLLDVSLLRSTGSRTLDRAALALVRRAGPFPPIPDALPDELEMTLPVEFLLSVSSSSAQSSSAKQTPAAP